MAETPLFLYPKRCSTCGDWISLTDLKQKFVNDMGKLCHVACKAPSPSSSLMSQPATNGMSSMEEVVLKWNKSSAEIIPTHLVMTKSTDINFADMKLKGVSLYQILVNKKATIQISQLIQTGLVWEDIQSGINRRDPNLMSWLVSIGFDMQTIKDFFKVTQIKDLANLIKSGKIKLSKEDWQILGISSQNYTTQLGLSWSDWMDVWIKKRLIYKKCVYFVITKYLNNNKIQKKLSLIFVTQWYCWEWPNFGWVYRALKIQDQPQLSPRYSVAR